VKRALVIIPVAAVLSACGGGGSSPSTPPAVPTTSPAALASAVVAPSVAGCRSLVPAGYHADGAHTGRLSAHTYSASADVQAALEYDQLKAGTRSVFVRRATPHAAATGVLSCVALRFSSAHLAGRFFLSYESLRDHSPTIVHKIASVKPVPGLAGTTAYFEKDQSFRGYRISSTNVIEVAGQSQDTLYITSVAGSSPSAALARTLLASIASQR
jgi:hypothetical protein